MLNFQDHRERCIISILGILLVGLAGCSANPLAGMHRDGVETNASVLTADGRAALLRGDYTRAVQYFSAAIAQNPRLSEARVGWAEAELKRRNFNLANFLHVIADDNSNISPSALLQPRDWGCQDNAELTAFFSSMLDVLDPVAQGLTDGAVRSNNVTLNLNVGLFYVLRMGARVESFSSVLEVRKFTKGTPEALALGIPQPVYDSLPNNFYWIANGPTWIQLQQVQSDIDHGMTRLQTAANNSSSNTRARINDIIDVFKSLQTQAHL